MTIVVHRNEPIDEALRRLQGETLRENIFEVVNEKRYFIPDTAKKTAQRREWKKRKRRSRSAKRKNKK